MCMVGDDIVEMPLNKRRFMMGNALVVDLIKQMEGEPWHMSGLCLLGIKK